MNYFDRDAVPQGTKFLDISDKADIHDTVKLSNFIEIRELCVIGENTRIGSFVIMGAGTWIGKNCQIHGMAAFADQGNHFDKDVVAPILGNNVILGTRCTIMGGVHIGDNAVIGAGSVVMCDVPAGETWVGTPARKLK